MSIPGSYQPSDQTSSPAYRIDQPPAAVTPAVDIEGVIYQQIQMMQAAGWRLHQRWPGGADFTSVTPPTISTGVHIILTVFTLGTWLLIWVLLELFGSGGDQKWCRLIVDERGQPQYSEIGRPQ